MQLDIRGASQKAQEGQNPLTAQRAANFNFSISRVHLFYDIQWKQNCGIPFIVKSHNNTDNKSKRIL